MLHWRRTGSRVAVPEGAGYGIGPGTLMMGQDRGMQQPRDFSMYGAVDLGARQAATQRRQQAARAASTGASGDGEASAFVIDVTEETFNTEVVVRSRTTPVIVDLWADWCGPCKQLSPVLERLADEAGGAWVLAKIDVDANQRLAAAFQVQSIPSIFAVIAGQPLPLFQGALPEQQVRRVLDEVMRVATENGLSGKGADVAAVPASAPADPDEVAAQEALQRGDIEAALASYRAVL